ncbi:hypothetical protein GCM10027298_23370 [Epidermidibacterium keratini]
MSPKQAKAMRAVVYLRVSTPKQMHTAVDIDADGNSIATQREYTGRRATELGAVIDREFVEPGNSAQSIDKRPVFRDLLKYVAETPGIDYVIIYMRSRAFRNLGDAVITKQRLAALGVKLISAKENFGDGYMADAMEAVTDIFNELESRRNGEDIKTKMRHKALAGGYNGRAKIGYLNARESDNGRLFNTIAIDPERAPLIRQMFELYASGDYSIIDLRDASEELGLTQRPTPKIPYPRPLVKSNVHKMLSDPFYAGWVTVDGQLIPGRHEAIVSQALFDRVQQVIANRSQRGKRDRILYHYLKGTLRCGRCATAGRTSRLVYTENIGRNGTRYGYYFCMGRQRKTCNLPHLAVAAVEHAIELHYRTLPVPENFVEHIEHTIHDALHEHLTTTEQLHTSLRHRLARLDAREARLIDLAADGALSRQKITQRANDIALERARIQARLDETSADLEVGAERLRHAIQLASSVDNLYSRLDDDGRAQLNEAVFEHIEIDQSEYETSVTRHQLTETFEEITEAATVYRRIGQTAPREGVDQDITKSASREDAEDRLANPKLSDVLLASGLSKNVMVELRGLEPLTPCMPCRCATSCAIAPSAT